jgi:predicted nucleotidyltransferase
MDHSQILSFIWGVPDLIRDTLHSGGSRDDPTRAVARILESVKQGLAELHGPRLRDLYLFGSRAPGEAEPDSDVDVLVVLHTVERYGEEVDRTSHLRAGLSLAEGYSPTSR